MPRKSRKSFVGHPSAILFLRISREGVFQERRARPVVGEKRKGTCLGCGISASDSPLGNYPASNESQAGPQAATMATAHKIAVIFYTVIKNQVEYDETIWNARDAEREKRLQAKLTASETTSSFPLDPRLHNELVRGRVELLGSHACLRQLESLKFGKG